ncbi:MAG: transcription termination/antitermination factor NusG [Candidatus Firestonebacteria bacterium]|nr:transcription termination/antitermination factor NusG [Candidatus Firestonebacteria bacterium]
MSKNWYVIHTYTGYENRVKANLEQLLINKSLVLDDFKILIPTQQITEVKGGKKQTVTRKYFPGYIMIYLEMTDDIWSLVKNATGVSKFIGTKGVPIPLQESEVNQILNQLETVKKPKVFVPFTKGENVKIIDGPFSDFSGVVDDVYPDKGKAKITVTVFGRATPIELEFNQIEKTQ